MIQEIKATHYVFEEGNEYRYVHDHRFFRGVPSNIRWEFVKRLNNDLFIFIGDGYGSKNHYGSGDIAVYGCDLPEYFKNALINKQP